MEKIRAIQLLEFRRMSVSFAEFLAAQRANDASISATTPGSGPRKLALAVWRSSMEHAALMTDRVSSDVALRFLMRGYAHPHDIS
jgi:hypothetical protein